MIEVQTLSKAFGRQAVLDSLDFSARAGERIALVGQNGSGKTTLMRCLLGLYRYRGRIAVDGFEPRTDRVRLLSRVAFVPQSAPGIRLRVREYLDLIEATCDIDRSSIHHHAMELGLDLDAVADRPFPALSGGMKQKLLIGAAIARRPRLLLMDEPGASLDASARAIFFRQLSRLPPETTMLITSHRVDELAGLVTRVVELDAGKKVLDDVVAGAPTVDLSDVCRVRLVLAPPPNTVVESLHEWGFIEQSDGAWEGLVAAPDRFRFLALVTRWSGLVRVFTMEDEPTARSQS